MNPRRISTPSRRSHEQRHAHFDRTQPGDFKTADELLSLVYEELRKLAAGC